MARVRDGDRVALVVVDMQVGVVQEAWDAPRVIDNVGIAVARARSAGVPVIWVQHGDDELATGSPPWQLAPPLAPALGDISVHKKHNSSFEATSLDAELARLGISRIVLAGAATNWCIRATAYGALDRGYDLTLVEDAHTTKSMRLEDGATLEAEALVRDLNVTMTRLEYPGVRNGTAKARDLDFGPRPDRANDAGAAAMGNDEPRVDRPPVRRFRDRAYRPQAATLGALRAKIDAIDAQVVELLASRALSVKDATRFKRSAFEVSAPQRQSEVFARVRALAGAHAAESPSLPDVVEAAYRVLVAGFIAGEERFFAETEPIDP